MTERQSILLKTQKVLDRYPVNERVYLQYSEDRDRTGFRSVACRVELSEEDVRDMGYPDAVTVTVEPGDTLNG